MEPQLEYVRDRFVSFLARVSALAAMHRPPGRNAANGHFRESMNHDPLIVSAGGPAEIVLTGDAQILQEIYVAFVNGLRSSFVHGNHGAHWATNSVIVGEKLEAMKKQVIAVAISIFSLMSGEDDSNGQQDQEQQNFIQALGELAKAVFSSEVKGSGAHANGWISVSAKHAANGVLNMLNSSFDENISDDGDRIASVIRSVCVQIAGLQTEGHKPWLRADWQVKLQAISGAAEITLRSYK